MEVDVAVVADGVVSLEIWGSGGNSGMPGTDSLERAAEALQGRKFCEFVLFSSSLHETSSFCSAPARAPRWSEISPSGTLLMLAVVN